MNAETNKITYGAYYALMQQYPPTVTDNHNRVNAWSDPQHEKTHTSEWEAETAKIT